MIYWLVLIIIVVLIIILLALSDITIHVRFRRSPDYQKSNTEIFLFKRIRIFHKKYTHKDKKEERNISGNDDQIIRRLDKFEQIILKSMDTIIKYNDFLVDINQNLGKGLKTAKLDLSSRIGTGDAAVTGILCGLVWAILGTLRMQKDYYKLFKDINFAVNPDYQKKIFAIDIESIFTIKTVYIIYVWILLNEIFGIEEEKTKTA